MSSIYRLLNRAERHTNANTKQERENLEELYKYIRICSVCKNKYGSDRKKDNETCAKCFRKMYGKQYKDNKKLNKIPSYPL